MARSHVTRSSSKEDEDLVSKTRSSPKTPTKIKSMKSSNPNKSPSADKSSKKQKKTKNKQTIQSPKNNVTKNDNENGKTNISKIQQMLAQKKYKINNQKSSSENDSNCKNDVDVELRDMDERLGLTPPSNYVG